MDFRHIKSLISLFRIKLSLAVSLTMAAGYLHCTHSFSLKLLFSFAGVFLLSAGSSALNQWQEITADSRMKRTVIRPLPLKLLTNSQVLFLSFITGSTGFLLLKSYAGLPAALLGLFTALWYNGVYTPLKKRTAYAFLIGSVSGALPPVIGLLASGQNDVVSDMVLIALFMCVWQISHFILILHKHLSGYTAAELPAPRFLSSEQTTKLIAFVAFLVTSIITLLFPVYGLIHSKGLFILLLSTNLCASLYFFVILIWPKLNDFFRPAFWGLLIYQLLIFIILVF